MNTEELDKLRLDDINFFAQRYSELFGKYFDRTTPQQKREFYQEIKEELLQKVQRYVIIDNDPIDGTSGEAFPDYIKISESHVQDVAIRMHELFHSYNHMENRKNGLKDFDSGLVLKELDEGSTEMFAQMICGNLEGNDIAYKEEVEITRFVTSLVGEGTMIRSTRGKPELLCETIDELLQTKGVLQNLSRVQYEYNDLVQKSFGQDGLGYPVAESTKILAGLKLEAIKGKSAISVLFDTVQQSGNYDLYNNLTQTDIKFGYNVIFQRSLGIDDNQFNPQEMTVASKQQEILKAEIDKLEDAEGISLQVALEIEIKKFLYDRISFQRHFLEHPSPQYDTYELTSEDTEFSENFRSDLDGAGERLKGKIGLFGPGGKVYSLENASHLINENMVKRLYFPEVDFDELQDYRLELWAERLNIAQEREFLDQWTTWTYNAYYKAMFPDGDEASFQGAIEAIRGELEEKEQGLIAKYKALEEEKQQEEQVLQPAEIWMDRFNQWYSADDKVHQGAKEKLTKMRSDCIKIISEGMQKKTNKQGISQSYKPKER